MPRAKKAAVETKQAVPAESTQAASEPKAPSNKPVKRTTHTNWGNLVRAKIVPTTVEVRAYKPVHPSDASPHTRIIPKPQPIIDNIRHGGGFRITFRNAKGGWRGFVDLQEAGIEITDFRCDICGQTVMVHPQHIGVHMQPHTNQNRRPERGGRFNVTLSEQQPFLTEEEVASEDLPDIIDID